MKITEQRKSNDYEIIEFGSLKEFYDYISTTPTNNFFDGTRSLASKGRSKYDIGFTQTKSYQEAVNLLKDGWSDMAAKLVQKLKVAESKMQPSMKQRIINSVAGYQAIVPLYLNGVPTNMVNKKMTPIKQKVITIDKSINYSCAITSEQIMEESIKAMQIIKKLESQGYRCNLNVVLGVFKNNRRIMAKVRVKSANEKLNVSKLAFPLVHPSMLRRLFFRFIEVYPRITNGFVWGYGTPAKTYDLKRAFPDDVILPAFIEKDINEIKTIEDLETV